jgi:hypothetical protein
MASVKSLIGRLGGLFLVLTLGFASSFAHASANVDCSIDDKFVKFEMEAIAGRNGPIVQVNVGTIAVKPAAGISPSAPELTFDVKQIVQQWLHRDDLKISIEIQDEKSGGLIALIIEARLNKKTEQFTGTYLLRVERGDATKALKGRIKECVAG